MLFPPARRITQRLTNDLARLTESLTPFLPPETGELKSLLTTTKLPIVIPTDIKRERSSPLTTTKLPIVIPADIKRERSSPLPPPSRQHRFIVLPGVLVGSLIVIILASLFVVPLDNGPESNGFGKAVGKWFAGGPLSGVINPSQHIDPPTPTPALRTIDEGYCGGRDIWGYVRRRSPIAVLWGQGTCNIP